MHYGHQLQFGTFITPLHTAPETVVDLAQRSEALGYDLVTFQDHPYQPRLLDTWTLLSWIAGRTERVHIAPNVLNLPLRSPATLARSAASLDPIRWSAGTCAWRRGVLGCDCGDGRTAADGGPVTCRTGRSHHDHP